PQKRSVLEPRRIAVGIDPCFRGFAKQSFRISSGGICDFQIEPRLFAVLNLIEHFVAVRCPIDGHNEEVAAAVTLGADLLWLCAARFYGVQAGQRIWISRLRIRRDLDLLHGGNVVDYREALDRPLVELDEGDAG